MLNVKFESLFDDIFNLYKDISIKDFSVKDINMAYEVKFSTESQSLEPVWKEVCCSHAEETTGGIMDMDWAKTKNIFIMLFFLLNVFLSIILIYTLNGNNITKDTIDDARQALAERGVAIICNIPDFNGSVGTLTYHDAGFDKKKEQ